MAIDLTEDTAIILDTDAFGETVSFTPFGGTARDIDIKFFDGSLVADPYNQQAEYTRPSMLTASADVPDLTHRSTILRGGVTYMCLVPDINLVKVMPFVLVELMPQ